MSFDVTIILKEFNYPESKVSILSKSPTQLFRVRIGDLKFQDNLSIMGDSLKKLAESHVTGGYPTRYAHEMLSYLPHDVRERFCTQKQVLCYEYRTHLTCFNGREITTARSFLQLDPAARIINRRVSTRPKRLGDDIVSYFG